VGYITESTEEEEAVKEPERVEAHRILLGNSGPVGTVLTAKALTN